MFKNSQMENLILHRNQTINLQCKLIDWFLSDLSLHQKKLLNSPEYKHQILYKIYKYDLRVHILRKLESCLGKMYKKCAEVTINLRYLTQRSYSFQTFLQ